MCCNNRQRRLQWTLDFAAADRHVAPPRFKHWSRTHLSAGTTHLNAPQKITQLIMDHPSGPHVLFSCWGTTLDSVVCRSGAISRGHSPTVARGPQIGLVRLFVVLSASQCSVQFVQICCCPQCAVTTGKEDCSGRSFSLRQTGV